MRTYFLSGLLRSPASPQWLLPQTPWEVNAFALPLRLLPPTVPLYATTAPNLIGIPLPVDCTIAVIRATIQINNLPTALPPESNLGPANAFKMTVQLYEGSASHQGDANGSFSDAVGYLVRPIAQPVELSATDFISPDSTLYRPIVIAASGPNPLLVRAGFSLMALVTASVGGGALFPGTYIATVTVECA